MENKSAPNPVEDYRRIQKEVREWENFLNDNFGYFAFTFAIASLGTNQPQFWALVSLIFIVISHQMKKSQMSSLLRTLEKKREKTPYDNFIIKEYRKTISFKRSSPFAIGFFTLVTIIAAPSLLPSEKAIFFLYGEKPYFDIRTLSFITPKINQSL